MGGLLYGHPSKLIPEGLVTRFCGTLLLSYSSLWLSKYKEILNWPGYWCILTLCYSIELQYAFLLQCYNAAYNLWDQSRGDFRAKMVIKYLFPQLT